MSSTPSIRKHQVVAIARTARGEADAAVADHDRRDAVPAGRRTERIPDELGVEMRVHVDEAGGHDPARASMVSRAEPSYFPTATIRSPAIGHVGFDRGGAAPVDDRAALQEEVGVHCSSRVRHGTQAP
jgi:hypothetical protein